MSSDQLNTKKRSADEAELEIDVNAPEPPSKKALRKAKKTKNDNGSKQSTAKDESLRTSQPETSALDGEDGKRSDYGIWIGNLSYTTTKEDILKFITHDHDHIIKQDQITRIHLPMSTERKHQNKGFAYVDFKSAEVLDTALELSENLLGGRRVLIKNAKDFGGRPQTGENKKEEPGKAPSKRIFVGNLPFDTTVDQLEEHFGACGRVDHVQMATFEDSGKCKGYAWVDFEQLSAAQTAMRGWTEINRMDGTSASKARLKDVEGGAGKRKVWLNSIAGRKLRMEFAEDKTTRYNKRFGKNATGHQYEGAPTGNGAASGKRGEGGADSGVPRKPSRGDKYKREKAKREAKRAAKAEYEKISSRYNTETVQKLTGAMVQGQGKKVTFN